MENIKFVKACTLFFLVSIMTFSGLYANERRVESKELVYELNHRRPFNTYAPYAYEYYYRPRDGNDGCNWQYTARGLVYTCQ